MSTTTLNAASDEQPERDPYAAYRTRYQALMSQTADALRRSLHLSRRR